MFLKRPGEKSEIRDDMGLKWESKSSYEAGKQGNKDSARSA